MHKEEWVKGFGDFKGGKVDKELWIRLLGDLKGD